jgi:hypothetical protein
MNDALTYWMYTNENGILEFTSIPPTDGKLYLAVTPDFLRRLPISLCEAPSGGDDNQNIYYVKGDISSIYAVGTDTSLAVMLFIALQNSVDGKDAKIHFMSSGEEYNFKTISDSGYERDIGEGDIIANKICFIRYNPFTGNIILINPSMDKEAAVSTLRVFNTATFNKLPTVRKESTEDSDVPEYEELVPISALNSLKERVEKLERRFIVGIGDPQDALEDAEEGAIYIKLGEILT